jgi:hypothetical protein
MSDCCDRCNKSGSGFPKGLLLIGLAVLALKAASRAQGSSGSFWEKMQQRMEQMPEDFPPRVMFDTIMAIKEDTTRILERLDGSSA